jgi:hypothetical protein
MWTIDYFADGEYVACIGKGCGVGGNERVVKSSWESQSLKHLDITNPIIKLTARLRKRNFAY